jgi:DNA-binding CsgD family transcriptional regulator
MRPPAAPDRSLIGRSRDCSVLSDLLTGKHHSPVVVIHGEAGIGKTAILRWAIDAADPRDVETVYCAGSPATSAIPFGGLRQLLDPLIEHGFPDPHHAWALTKALDSPAAAGEALSRTAMRVLDFLTSASTLRRIVLVADDYQWMDRPTRDVLTFVGRRLQVDPLALLFGVRSPLPPELDEARVNHNWSVLHLQRLTDVDAATLLRRIAPSLEDADHRRVLDAALGNPLALAELPQTITMTRSPMVLNVPVNRRLEAAFAARLPAQSDVAQALILIAAMHETGQLDDVLDAGAAQRGTHAGLLDELESAARSGLIVLDADTVRFPHPLVRSAVYQAANATQRRAAHRALEQTARSAERRAWHAAAAAEGPDESIAQMLEEVADDATRVGALESALAALEGAARVSSDPARQAGRLLRGLELSLQLGQPHRSRDLLGQIEAAALSTGQRATLEWYREVVTNGPWSGGERTGAFTAIAERLRESGQASQALQVLITVALRIWWSNVDAETSAHVAEVAERCRADTNDPWYCAVIAVADPVARGRETLAILGRIAVADIDADATLLVTLGIAGTGVGNHPQAVTLLNAATAEARRQGRIGVLVQSLVAQSWAELHIGRLSRAIVAGEESVALARETDQPLWLATGELACAAVWGLRGDTKQADELIRSAETLLVGLGANSMLAQVQVARGFAALGAGRYDDAFAQLSRLFIKTDPSYHQYLRLFVVGELAEAAAHCSRLETARLLLSDVGSLLDQAAWPILRAGWTVARPLLEEDAAADLYRQGLADGLPTWPIQRARLHLDYGSWLRRQRRIVEARDPLRIAHETFAALGASPWAERAAQELRAAGEVHRDRSVAAWEGLTSQELHIATLAAQGLTNREIGDRLFLSHRTIGAHLYRIFPKLNITSRVQLGPALTDSSKA